MAVLAVRKPRTLLAVPALSAGAAEGSAALGVKPRDIRGFSLVAPAFGVLFAAGLWLGLFLLLTSTLRRQARDRSEP